MAIPSLVNGVLPPGTYSATLGEVRASFDQPGSRTRLTLNAALEHAANLIWSRDVTATLYVNGSYVTAKVDPLDVDLAVRSDVWDDTQFAAAFSAAYPGEDMLVDFFFNPQQSSQHMEELFREIQGAPQRRASCR